MSDQWPLVTLERVTSMQLLGVILQDNLNDYVLAIVSKRPYYTIFIFAPKTLKVHWFSEQALHFVCTARLVSSLTSALPSWFGFASQNLRF